MDKSKLSLKNLCIGSIARHLWKLKNDEVLQMHYYFRYERVKPENETWNQLTREVIKPLESVNVPRKLYNDIVYLVYIMKQRRRDWYQHLECSSSFYDMPKERFLDLFFKKLCWTQWGTVDEEETLGECYRLWIRNHIERTNADWWKLFILCSQYCSEMIAKEFQMNMQIWTDRESVENVNFYESYECHLALYWYKWFHMKNLEDFIRDIKRNYGDPLNFYNESHTVEENLFKLALHGSFKNAVIYFWPRVNKVKRDGIILDYFSNPLTGALFKHSQLGNNYKGMQRCEVHLLIWNNVSENMKKMIAANKDFVGRVIKCSHFPNGEWPIDLLKVQNNSMKKYYTAELYQEFCSTYANKTNCPRDSIERAIKCSHWPISEWPIDLLILQISNMKKYFTAQLYQDFCNAITYQNKKIYHEDLKLPVEDNKFQEYFNALWKIIPVSYKQGIAEKVIDNLFTCWDVLNLKMILNDKDLRCVREKLITKGENKFLLFAEERNERMVKEFLCELLVPGTWTKGDQENLKELYQNVIEGKFDMAKSGSSKKDVKEFINEKFVCYYFVKCGKFDWADKFLSWKLGTADRVKSFKATFYADVNSVDHIFKLWDLNKGNSRNAEMQCNQFLDWFLGDGLKRRFFIQEKIAKIVIAYPVILKQRFVDREIVDMMDDFLIRWLVLTKKEIRACKNEIFKDNLHVLMGMYMTDNKIDTARKVLNSAFDTEEERNNFLRGFFEKKPAIRGVKYFISDIGTFDIFESKLTAEEIKKETKNFIKFWCRPLKKFDRLKKDLERWPELFKMEIDHTTDHSAELNEIYLEGVGDEPDPRDYYYNHDAYLSAYYEYLDEAGMYFAFCEEKNLNIFMKLLRCFEVNKGEFCC